jgi:hypothetical protein
VAASQKRINESVASLGVLLDIRKESACSSFFVKEKSFTWKGE